MTALFAPRQRRVLSWLAIWMASGWIACTGGGVGAEGPPAKGVEFWSEQAEHDTELWRASLAWCRERPGHLRCEPIASAAVERLLGGEPETPARTFALVPPELAAGQPEMVEADRAVAVPPSPPTAPTNTATGVR